MKLTLPILLPALVLAAAALTVAANGASKEKAPTAMTRTATAFLASLTPELKATATFPFADAERKNWHFVPIARKGLPLKQMDAKQRELALGLLKTGLSQKGYLKAATIMSLETVLKEIEQGKGPNRDPEMYHVSIFGTPSESAPWGWRFEGHHLAINFTLAKGKVNATPTFFGANPAEVRQDIAGKKGLRALKDEEEAGRALLDALDEKQRAEAIALKEAPNDIISFDKVRIEPLSNEGIAATKLTGAQKKLLQKLVDVYAQTMDSELAKDRLAKIKAAGGWDKVVFLWAGSTVRGEKHYYRVQGPTFLIEYDNTQNNANHIHSVWRDFHGDFGEDLLAEHYALDHHPTTPSEP